ncbi:serine protease [Pseudomonas frederiksbergensis]|uniref:Serine protease n=1 Tax=Pseudomonas frederiksbergensis TaxID=104087 RepID=A0A1J0EL75_9PSED|nr:NfeD family protein [Pseudomonas frederiksbergensis]APC16608.1 serine protease [Pseudomonas frederiksbergensis]
MNTRGWCAVALLLGLSGSVFAADTVVLIVPNPLGVWLMMFGIAFIVAEAVLPNYGVVGLGGILMFVIGAVILSNADVPTPLIIGLGLISALLLVALLIHALKTRPRHIVSGDAGLLGSVTQVTALQDHNTHKGWVHLQGERWQVHCKAPLHPGQRVRVVARKGTLLEVAAADAAPQGE